MYAEFSIKHPEKETQRILHDEEKFLKLYPFLSQTGEMLQQLTEQEMVRIMDLFMDLIKDSIQQDYQNENLKKCHNKKKWNKDLNLLINLRRNIL